MFSATTLFIIIALDAFGFSMSIVCINPHIISLGGTAFFQGILMSSGALFNLLWSPIAGSLSDSMGRKPVILRCMGLCLIGNLITAFTNNLAIFFIARMLTSFGAPVFSIIKSMVDDNVSDKDRKLGIINNLMATMGASMILGPLIGGFLSEAKYVFILICCNIIVNMTLISTMQIKTVTQKQKKDERSPGNKTKGITELFLNFTKINWQAMWDVFAVKLSADFIANVFFFTSHHVLTHKFNSSAQGIGVILAINSVTAISLNLTLSKLKKRFYGDDKSGLQRLFHCGLILMASTIGSVFASTYTIYLLCFVLLGISRTIMDDTVNEVVLARASETEKGTTMGVFDSTFFLSGVIAPILSGVLLDSCGMVACAVVLGVLPAIFATGLVIRQTRMLKNHQN